mmetsp:Transcript_44648/g.123745  ORF Transcript_44648/g.123745 Transcript_44648/m.123745 type:complete len:453 (-) Transcript_44648:67-1425(-)
MVRRPCRHAVGCVLAAFLDAEVQLASGVLSLFGEAATSPLSLHPSPRPPAHNLPPSFLSDHVAAPPFASWPRPWARGQVARLANASRGGADVGRRLIRRGARQRLATRGGPMVARYAIVDARRGVVAIQEQGRRGKRSVGTVGEGESTPDMSEYTVDEEADVGDGGLDDDEVPLPASRQVPQRETPSHRASSKILKYAGAALGIVGLGIGVMAMCWGAMRRSTSEDEMEDRRRAPARLEESEVRQPPPAKSRTEVHVHQGPYAPEPESSDSDEEDAREKYKSVVTEPSAEWAAGWWEDEDDATTPKEQPEPTARTTPAGRYEAKTEAAHPKQRPTVAWKTREDSPRRRPGEKRGTSRSKDRPHDGEFGTGMLRRMFQRAAQSTHELLQRVGQSSSELWREYQGQPQEAVSRSRSKTGRRTKEKPEEDHPRRKPLSKSSKASSSSKSSWSIRT